MIKLRILLQSNYFYIALIIITALYVFLNINIEKESIYKSSTTVVIGKIIDIRYENGKVNILVKGKEKIIVNYYFDNDSKLNLKLGDYIKAIGEVMVPPNNTIFNLFNYKQYLYNRSIYYIFKANQIIKVKNNNNPLYYLKQTIIDRIEKSEAKEYLSVFILGNDNYLDNNIIDSYRLNGLLHLFSISGTQVSLIAFSLLYLLGKLQVEIKKKYLIVFICLSLYAFIIGFPASLLRSIIFLCILAVNKIYYLKIKSINSLIITFSILLLANPFYIYDIGFQFSFIIVFFILISSHVISHYKNIITKSFVISIISFLASLPLVLIYNFEFSLISSIINVFYIFYITYIVFPLCLITFIFEPFIPIFLWLVKLMENISLYVSKYRSLIIVLGKINIFLVLVYYVLFVLAITKRKFRYIMVMFILLLLYYNLKYINSNFEMTFIDVGQGDAIFIKYPYNMKNILIDTGGRLPFQDIGNKLSDYTIIPYLKSLGISKIDYLILTHGDYDHAGEAINIINNFKIEK